MYTRVGGGKNDTRLEHNTLAHTEETPASVPVPDSHARLSLLNCCSGTSCWVAGHAVPCSMHRSALSMPFYNLILAATTDWVIRSMDGYVCVCTFCCCCVTKSRLVRLSACWLRCKREDELQRESSHYQHFAPIRTEGAYADCMFSTHTPPAPAHLQHHAFDDNLFIIQFLCLLLLITSYKCII